MSKLWRQYGEILHDSLSYIFKRATGEIKSLKSPWQSFNAIGMNGIEWNSLYVLASRPSTGKTLINSTLARGLQQLNKDQDFAVLHFQFEMLGRNLGIRELSAGTKLNIRYIQSADDYGMPPLSEQDKNRLMDYARSQSGREEYVIDKPLTVFQMAETIEAFYAEIQKPFIVTLDHTLLVRQDASESSRQVTLQNLATMLVEKKNKLPVAFIILTQLNREIDDADRQKPGQLSNYPGEADVYGSKQNWTVLLFYPFITKHNPVKQGNSL